MEQDYPCLRKLKWGEKHFYCQYTEQSGFTSLVTIVSVHQSQSHTVGVDKMTMAGK